MALVFKVWFYWSGPSFQLGFVGQGKRTNTVCIYTRTFTVLQSRMAILSDGDFFGVAEAMSACTSMCQQACASKHIVAHVSAWLVFAWRGCPVQGCTGLYSRVWWVRCQVPHTHAQRGRNSNLPSAQVVFVHLLCQVAVFTPEEQQLII